MKKVYAGLAGIGVIVGILTGWFEFAQYPPYATAAEAKEIRKIARTAKQQAFENRVDSQQNRVIAYETHIDTVGATPERKQRLRELNTILDKFTQQKNRSYK